MFYELIKLIHVNIGKKLTGHVAQRQAFSGRMVERPDYLLNEPK